MEYESARRLRALMETHGLSRQDVAEKLCGGKVSTVHSWLRRDRYRRNVPIQKVKLLELLLEKEKDSNNENSN